MYKYVVLFAFVGLVVAEDNPAVEWTVCRQGKEDVECVKLNKPIPQDIASQFDNTNKTHMEHVEPSTEINTEDPLDDDSDIKDEKFENLYEKLNRLKRLKETIIKNKSRIVFNGVYDSLKKIERKIAKIEDCIEAFIEKKSKKYNKKPVE